MTNAATAPDARLDLDALKAGLMVAGLSRAKRQKRNVDAVLSIEDPKARPFDKLRFSSTPHPPHLVLAFEDLDAERPPIPTATAEQVGQALGFARAHACGRLLVHCQAGISRSTAIALAILADRLGPGHERLALDVLLELRPEAVPNLVVVAHADALLVRNGALTGVVAAWEAADRSVQRRREMKLQYFLKNPSLFSGWAAAGIRPPERS